MFIRVGNETSPDIILFCPNMRLLVILTSMLSLAAAATEFPHTPIQWPGGLTTSIFLPVGSGGLCGWEVKLEFDYMINKIAPHNFILRKPKSNSKTFYIVNEHWNPKKPPNSELMIGFNAYFDKKPDLTVKITSAKIISKPCSEKQTNSNSKKYADVLGKSILFYEAQRSGKLPANNRISWRGDSALNDGQDVGVDLSGGWYDAGDHVKFNLPMAWSTTVLAWGVVEFKKGYEVAGQLDYMYDSLRWPLDYFLKCWDPPSTYWAQVGDGHADHGVWTRPEDLNMERPAYNITKSNPGSDVAGETAAAFAAASIVFKSKDPAYAATLLDRAKSLFDFAYKYQGTYVEQGGVPAGSFYNSWSGYKDELCWAAAWLYKATGDITYSDKAQEFLDPGLPPEFSWDNKIAGCQVLMNEAKTLSIDLQGPIETFMSSWRDSAPKTPKCHLSYNKNNNWGSLRYAANSALIGLMAAEAGIKPTENRKWALSQIDYMIGANEQCRSYVVGYGINPPQHAHHRGASCDPDHSIPCTWNNFNSPDPNPSVLIGALVGGPSLNGSYQDVRSNFESNEVACDYNAGFQSVLAGLVKLDAENNFPEHINKCCSC